MKRFLVLILILSLFIIGLAVVPVAASGCYPNTPPVGFAVNDLGEVAQVYSSRRADLGSAVVLDRRYHGETFKVLDTGCSGAHYWVKVEYVSDGAVGWATEGYNGVYWLKKSTGGIPPITYFVDPVSGVRYYAPNSGEACPGAPLPRLSSPNGTAQVAQFYSTLRRGIHSNKVIRIIYGGEALTVDEGPFCAFGPYNWYKITDSKNNTGWVTEGTGTNNYWLKP